MSRFTVSGLLSLFAGFSSSFNFFWVLLSVFLPGELQTSQNIKGII